VNHLGRRVSDLLDGQLSAAETEAAWAHVHTCHLCRDEVEREGWVKTRLSTLGFDDDRTGCAPDRLKGMLLGTPGDCLLGGSSAGDEFTNLSAQRSRSRSGIGGKVGMAALGGGAAGAAFMGMLALGPAPAQIPVPERNQQPVTHLNPTAPGPRVPVRFNGR
jgi:hypothetical protein